MGLRERALQYREVSVYDIINKLEGIYEDRGLKKTELIEIKNEINRRLSDANEKLKKKSSYIQALYEIIKITHSKSNANSIFYKIMEILKAYIGAEKFIIFSNERSKLIIKKENGLNKSILDRELKLSKEEENLLSICKTDIIPYSVKEIIDENLQPFEKEWFLLVPLSFCGEALGGIIIYTQDHNKIKNDDAELIQFFSIVSSLISSILWAAIKTTGES